MVSDPFTDVADDEDGGESVSSDEDSAAGLFADAVAKPFDHHDESFIDPYARDRTRTYRDSDDDRGADDVNPQSLFRRTSIPELRYYYREGEFGATVVDKPIEDAFKHGFTVHDEGGGTSARDYLKRYVPKMKLAEKKARRDGFAVLEFKTRESGGADINAPPSDVQAIERHKVWTVDDFDPDVDEFEVIEHVDLDVPEAHNDGQLDTTDISVTEHGIVVVDNPALPQHEDLLGYGLQMDDASVEFLHRERTQHFAWRTTVDGDPTEKSFGKWEGDSVLTPVVHVMRQIKKGNWGMGQALFRYSAPLHVVETPMEMNEDQWKQLKDETGSLNAASEYVASPGTKVKGIDAASEFDPEPFYAVLIEQICSATEFTKSVLIGTQTGTVSGSETDIKSYFNQVQRYRQTRAETKMGEALKRVSQMAPSIVPTFATGRGVSFEWAPLFKVDQVERAEALRTTVNAATQAVQNFVMTPDEARSFVESEFVSFNSDVSFDELTEDDWDDLDRINLRKTGQKSPSDEPDMGNPRVGQNGGGAEGTGGGASNPVAATDDFGTITAVGGFSDVAAPTTFTDDQAFHSGDKVATPNGPGVVNGVYDEPIEWKGERIEASDDNEVYVVGFGGSSLPYREGPLESNENLADETTEGEALGPEYESVDLDDVDFPPSWQNSDTPIREILLDFWSSVGGSQKEAANEMTSWSNVTEDEANAMAAMMKDAVLGTKEWRGEGGFAAETDT